MNKLEEVKAVLAAESQEHVLEFVDSLDEVRRGALFAQIEKINFSELRRMKSLLSTSAESAANAGEMVPVEVESPEGELLERCRAAGNEALAKGEVAVILVAGGQGSRLGFEAPKGEYPIGELTGASLFYFHARKILARGGLPFYIMTSEANDAETRRFFKENDFFGLDPANVIFFTQGMWPALTADGKIILDEPGHIFMSPDGHGGTLSALESSGALADMERRGVKYVFYFQVDNPLVEVADPAFIGLHILRGADVSLKLCAKRDPDEGLGMPVIRNGRTEMVEYTELTSEQKNRRREDGELYFKFGSVAIHIFSLDFIKRQAEIPMPLHIAHKKIPILGKKPDAPNAYKFEKFIFDVLPNASKVVNMAFLREDEFAPVKNAEGNDSPASCRAALDAKWRRRLSARGIKIDGGTLEVDPVAELGA